MRVYISGPISGYKNFNRSAFEEAERNLKAKGYEVINPLNYPVDEYHVCMKRDIALLLKCDAIFLLQGWSRSNGAKTELAVACAIGLEVWNETDEKHPCKTTSIHHRLPKSKSSDGLGGYPIEINDTCHRAWHTLFQDYDADKICFLINTYYLNPEWEFVCERRKHPHL